MTVENGKNGRFAQTSARKKLAMKNGFNNGSLVGRTAVLYGRSAATRRDVERAARDRGVKIAATLRESVDVVVLGEGEPTAQVRTRLAAEFDERSRRAFEAGTLEIVSETEFLRRLTKIRSFKNVAETLSERSSAPPTPEKRGSLFDFLADSETEIAPQNLLKRPETPRFAENPDGAENSLENAAFLDGCTPAAVAELVGVSIQTIRRWRRRGLLVATVEAGLLPYFSTEQILVAKRLAFLCSTGLSDDFIERRVAAFREFAPIDSANGAPSVATILLKTTLSSDGRDVLFAGPDGPLDWRGQRRFDFGAAPTDGSFSMPTLPAAPFLSDAEEELALAEKLAAWNAAQNVASADVAPTVPAFLALFQNGDAFPKSAVETPPFDDESKTEIASEIDSPSTLAPPSSVLTKTSRSFPESARKFDFAAPPAFAEATFPTAFSLSKETRERWRDATNRRVVQLCETAWRLENAGYWDEAVRVYRSALLAGGLDAGVSFRLGKVLYLTGDFAAARERFYAALELDEDYVDARFELARTFVALNELDDALAALQGVVEDRPDDPTFRLELGKLYLRLGRRADAEAAFRFAATRIDDEQFANDVWRLIYELTKRRL